MTDKETLYARWLSNEITDEELESLKDEGVLDDLQQIVNTTDSWSLPAYNKSEGFQKIKSKQITKKLASKNVYLPWVAGITACLLLIFAIVKYNSNNEQDVIWASNGDTEKLNLIDGSVVTINDGSSISYNKENWSSDRSIDLIGEAYFQVEKGTPFVVNTKNGTIEVLGTQFNVRAWGSNLHVECYEGSVKVRTEKDQSILVRNESVSVIDITINDKQIINRNSPLWSEGTSRFEGEKIREVFLELERQYDITISSPELTQSFSGIFLHNDLDNALQSICKPLGLEYKISDDQSTVTIE